MLNKPDFDNFRLIRQLARKRRVTALILSLENLGVHGWRLFFWTLFFLSLWMMQLPMMLGQFGAVTVLALFGAGVLYFTWADVRHFRLPNERQIDRRIEEHNKLPHRPVSELDDKLANPMKAETRDLWMERRARMVAALKVVKIPPLRALIAARDPYALRLGVSLLFIVAAVMAGSQWDERIMRGLTPVSFASAKGTADDINIWITPPEYTGTQQIVLRGKGGSEILKIPRGSKIKARVTGGIGRPALKIGGDTQKMQHLGEDSYGIEAEVPAGETIAVTQLFLRRAAWNYKLIPDYPPALAPKGEPEVLQHGQVRFPLTVYDDYGVRDMTMSLALDPMVEDAPLGDPFSETRSVMSPAGTHFEVQPVYDLAAHPWAGLPVVITFSVSDHQEQTGAMEPIKMILPEREFQHPVARVLIEARRKISWAPIEAAPEVSGDLSKLLVKPSAFQNDIVVFLAIRTASSRLRYSPSIETAKALQSLLWDAALRIEDGNLSLAARDLREAQKKLEQALQNPNVTEAEIASLMDEMRAAMAEYLMELQREMQKRAATGETFQSIPPEMLSSLISPEALGAFLDQMESEMMGGNREAAREMLSQLQRMMDMMDPSMTMPMPPDMKFMSEGINELQELIDRQQELLDQTKQQLSVAGLLQDQNFNYGEMLPFDEQLLHEWGLEIVPPAPAPPVQRQVPVTINTQASKVEQEALRIVLGQLMLAADEALGKIPENMGLAEQEMRGSSLRLGENNPALSIPHQEQAIAYLKEAAQQMGQQLMARLQQVTGMSLSGGMRLDPLGRPYGGDGDLPGLFPGSRVKIPEESERKRVEEILNLLRRRSGELERPQEELEYYRRLLRQF